MRTPENLAAERDPTLKIMPVASNIVKVMRTRVEPLDERNYEGTGHSQREQTAGKLVVSRDGFDGSVLFSRSYDPTINPEADSGADEEFLVAGLRGTQIVFYHSQRSAFSTAVPEMSPDSNTVLQALKAVAAELGEA